MLIWRNIVWKKCVITLYKYHPKKILLAKDVDRDRPLLALSRQQDSESISQRWAAQHIFQVRNTQFHSFVFVVRKTQLRSVSKFVSALCAMPQLRTLPLRTITVGNQNVVGWYVALLVLLLTQV